MTANVKPEVKVVVHIVPGKVSEHQKRLWRAFWTRLLATVQSELKAQNEAKRE